MGSSLIQSPPRFGSCDGFPDQTVPRRTALSVVDSVFGLTKSYLRTLAFVSPAAIPLISRWAPVVVLVVATRVPADLPNGSNPAISRKRTPWPWCTGLSRYNDGPLYGTAVPKLANDNAPGTTERTGQPSRREGNAAPIVPAEGEE
jgi:hypothetical protein